MAVKDYDPKKVLVIIAGQQASGFAEGTFISVEREVDTFTKSVGTDGEVTRTRSHNKSGMLTLTLTQTSSFNDVLSALHVADELTGNGVVPILITDLLGNTKLFGATGWVRKPANAEYGNEAGNREWALDIAELDMFVGGAS